MSYNFFLGYPITKGTISVPVGCQLEEHLFPKIAPRSKMLYSIENGSRNGYIEKSCCLKKKKKKKKITRYNNSLLKTQLPNVCCARW